MISEPPITHAEAVRAAKKKEKQSIKCVVWDLDDTIWDGILLEDRVGEDGLMSTMERADAEMHDPDGKLGRFVAGHSDRFRQAAEAGSGQPHRR